MIPKDIEKWDNNNWDKQVVYCRPSSGGAVGVVFVYAGRLFPPQHLLKPKDATFVIKPIQGTGAPTKFAEHMLGKIAGAVSPNSRPIPRRSLCGSGLVLVLKKFRDKETNTDVRARWKEIFTKYDQCDTFLIQETQTGIKELGDTYREEGGLTEFLSDKTRMINLGRLFAADNLIGNGDRLSNMNTGNILFKGGKFSAIDSTAIIVGYDAIVKDSKAGLHSLNTTKTGVLNPVNWATYDVINEGNTQAATDRQRAAFMKTSKMQTLAPSAALVQLFDVENWWNTKFRPHFSKAPDKPSDAVWNQAKIWFKEGVDKGTKEIDKQLSGLNWLMMKSKYKGFVSKYGGDPNLDWTSLKIRRMYIKLRRKGVSEEQALRDVQEYVKRKLI